MTMPAIKFTASVFKDDQGLFRARADELSLISDSATTARGAIKKLKTAVRKECSFLSETDDLVRALRACGYSAVYETGDDEVASGRYGVKTLEPDLHDQKEILLPLARRLFRK